MVDCQSSYNNIYVTVSTEWSVFPSFPLQWTYSGWKSLKAWNFLFSFQDLPEMFGRSVLLPFTAWPTGRWPRYLHIFTFRKVYNISKLGRIYSMDVCVPTYYNFWYEFFELFNINCKAKMYLTNLVLWSSNGILIYLLGAQEAAIRWFGRIEVLILDTSTSKVFLKMPVGKIFQVVVIDDTSIGLKVLPAIRIKNRADVVSTQYILSSTSSLFPKIEVLIIVITLGPLLFFAEHK